MNSSIAFRMWRVTGPTAAHRAALTALLCIASVAPMAALSEPPASLLLAPREILPPATLSRAPITALTMGSLRIALGTTTLDDVREAMGGAIEYDERGGASRYRLCYTIPHDESWQRIWLISDERTGRIEIDHRISQIEALETMNKDAAPDCPIPTASYLPPHFDQGVWLGQSEQGLLQALGRPAERSRGDWSYVYYNAIPDRGATRRTDHVVSMVQAQVQVGKITAIVASQITTY